MLLSNLTRVLCNYRRLLMNGSKQSQFHSKNTRVSVTRKGGHWNHTPFRVKSDLEFGQLYADLTNNEVRLTQFWVRFRVKLINFRVIADPEWSLAPMDPFSGHAVPGCFFFRKLASLKYNESRKVPMIVLSLSDIPLEQRHNKIIHVIYCGVARRFMFQLHKTVTIIMYHATCKLNFYFVCVSQWKK